MVIALVLFPLLGFGQESDELEQAYYNAEYFQQNNQFEEALPLYLKLLNNGKTNGNIQFKTGYTYLNISGLKYKAIPFLEKAIESASERYNFKRESPYSETRVPIESIMFLGQAYQANNEFEKALKTYLVYKETINNNSKKSALVDYNITSCKYAMEMIKSSSDLNMISFQGISMDGSSFNAAISGDGNSICFNVKRQHYNAIYFARKLNGIWSFPRNITMEVESDGTYFVSSLSHDGTILFLSHKNIDDYDLFKCNFSEERWTKSTPLNSHINSMYDEMHAILKENNASMYFVSNRKGGHGGFDIYKSVKDQAGDWGPAENLSSNINTTYNENTPFFSRDGKKLYFSSEGHNSMGGYDIQFSDLEKVDTWSDPINIGNPLNTGGDDLFFVPVSMDTLGIVSRLNKKPEERKSILLVGNFYTDISIPMQDTVHVLLTFLNNLDNSKKNIDIEIINSDRVQIARKTIPTNQKDITFIVPPGKYIIKATGEGINSEPVTFNVYESIESPQVSIEMKLFNTSQELTKFYINPVYFETDQTLPEKNSINILNKIIRAMEYYPSVMMKITGYTDSMGSIPYNQQLSYNRANSVKNYLTSHNISEKRIEIAGLGASNPIAKNEDDGIDNPNGRRLNRRVTFLFSGPGSDNIIFKDLPPKEGNL